MYKILIADDEEIIGTCLKKMIDWKSINAEVIGVALDGEEALKMFRETEYKYAIYKWNRAGRHYKSGTPGYESDYVDSI